MPRPTEYREKPHPPAKLRAMGAEDARRWWEGMTTIERMHFDHRGSIRGNLEYDKGFRAEWSELLKGRGCNKDTTT
jgi:hypothetical protein